MSRSLLISITAIAAAGLFVTGFGLGATGSTSTKLSAKLDSRHETPAPRGAVRAVGTFSATLSGRSVTWRLIFSRLTGKALAAHIHLGKIGVAGPVAVPLCGPCARGAHGKVTVTGKIRSALLAGVAYVNVHTAKNPAGEIRGQVAAGKTAAATTPRPASTTETTTTESGGGGYGGEYG